MLCHLFIRINTDHKPPKDLAHHSNTVSQYCSIEYRPMLEGIGMKTSINGIGDCIDNDPLESFWEKLNTDFSIRRRSR
jgi:putative transposase